MNGSIADLFPSSPREVYEAAPLLEVVCQFRFPRLLAIETKPPADFQERIRAAFPILETDPLPPAVNALSLPKDVLQMLNAQIGGPVPAYRFMNEPRTSTISLTSEILTISTTHYTEWKNFKESCLNGMSALVDIYKPTFFTRIGLRYVDVINRSVLGIEDKKWSQLIKPAILGQFVFPAHEENVEDFRNEIRLRLPDGSGSVTLRHGLATVSDRPGTSYLIDFDFYQFSHIEVANAERTIDYFNALSGNAFRACVEPELRAALKPRALASNW